MIWSLCIIVAVGGTSLYFTEFEGETFFRSLLLPSVALLALLALAVWLYLFLERRGRSSTIEGEGGGTVQPPGDGPGGDAGGGL